MLSTGTIQDRLEAIDVDLAKRVDALEASAASWTRAKRDQAHARAVAFINSEGTVAERSALADRETALIGKECEAEYVAVKAVVQVLTTRASIGQSLLKAYGSVA